MQIQVSFVIQAGATIRRVEGDSKSVYVHFVGHEPMRVELVDARHTQFACAMVLPAGHLPAFMQGKVSVFETFIQADVRVPPAGEELQGPLAKDQARYPLKMGKYVGQDGLYALVLSSGDPAVRKVVVKGPDFTKTLEFFHRLLNSRVEPILGFPAK